MLAPEPVVSAEVDPIARLVRGEVVDPVTGEPLDVQVRSVVIEDNLDGRELDLVRALDLGERLAVVSDPDTEAALGRRVARVLDAGFAVQRLGLPRAPHADRATVDRVIAALAPGTDALIAVGSGTINDVCKMAAAELGRPYVVFGTAPSMNGYTSVSASITVGGMKRSFPARAPIGAFFDLSVACRAPLRMIRGGLGECLCRATAQTDWLMAHLLLDQPYRDIPFELLIPEEPELFEHSDALVGGDRRIMAHLMRTLVMSGFGMTIAGGSHPASQGEHLISHYVDMMRGHDDGEGALHGEQMAITTQVMADLQRRVLDLDRPPAIQPCSVTRDALVAHFGPERGEGCWEQFERKRLTPDRAERLAARLQDGWDELRRRLEASARGRGELRAILARAGAPTEPADIGWSDTLYRDACGHARMIRDRFTFLDLAAALGVPVLDEPP